MSRGRPGDRSAADAEVLGDHLVAVAEDAEEDAGAGGVEGDSLAVEVDLDRAECRNK